jgi:hypothetical protein
VHGHHILAEVAVNITIKEGGEGKRVREVYKNQGGGRQKQGSATRTRHCLGQQNFQGTTAPFFRETEYTSVCP